MRGIVDEFIETIPGIILFFAAFSWCVIFPTVGLLWMMGFLK